MKKRFTIGVTTFNESATIGETLTLLGRLPTDECDIVVYDDCSTDETAQIIQQLPLARQENFRLIVADSNNGTPSVGRTVIGRSARTEYVVLLDGDDLIQVDEFRRFVADAPSGQDIILTSYSVRDRRIGLKGEGGPFSISNDTASKVISGIGGKAYRSTLLHEFGPDPVKGRSDDVRLNMRIISSARRNLYHCAGYCFYLIRESRKSTRASSLNFFEIEARILRYRVIQEMYGLDNSYLISLRKQLLKIADEDPTLQDHERQALSRRVRYIFAPVEPAQEPKRPLAVEPASRLSHAERASKKLASELRSLINSASA